MGGGTITRILDGDTVEVEFRRRVRVRFRDCWAPETKETKHPSEKRLGLMAKKQLESIVGEDKTGTLKVATDGDNDVGDGLTFGRVVGDIWLDGHETSLVHQMIDSGHCYRTKTELEAYLTLQDSLQ
jgi:endonuclease YncB( thermonuclease family)